MAAIKNTSVSKRRDVTTKKRPGIISKCRTSKNKNSKYYVKAYRGQGR